MNSVNLALSKNSMSPLLEMGAYEALWVNPKASFKVLAECFKDNPDKILSELVPQSAIEEVLEKVVNKIRAANINDYGVRIYGTEDYPSQLRDAANPLEFLYFRGWWDLVNSPKRIAIVGTRNPTGDGVKRAAKLVRLLVNDGYTIISGLAKGIDTVAHKVAIESKGQTIAVIGTPITESYPAENRKLQELIARNYLLISQVPVWRYSLQTPYGNKFFFPERNITMSALSQATVIIEASDTSGTLTQARAALQQGRKLFILDSCFKIPKLMWPHKYLERGAIRVKDYDDIRAALE